MTPSIVLASYLLLGPIFASASGPGRSLPSGEGHPAVIEDIYSSPLGEVHFVRINGGHSAMLRKNSGHMGSLQSVDGPVTCAEWLTASKGAKPPRGCDFLFRDDANGVMYKVRSEELEPASLFRAISNRMQDSRVAL